MAENKKVCGDCFLCCTGILKHVVRGVEIGGDVDCPHISSDSEARCSIYDDRPSQCVGYKCTWLAQDSWPEFMQPNKSGILGTSRTGHLQLTYLPFVTSQAREFVDRYASDRNIKVKKNIYMRVVQK